MCVCPNHDRVDEIYILLPLEGWPLLSGVLFLSYRGSVQLKIGTCSEFLLSD